MTSRVVAIFLLTLMSLCGAAQSQEEVAEKEAVTEADFVGVMRDGKVLVPMRKVFEMLGAQVTWNQATKTIGAARGDRNVVLAIGAKQARVNGTERTLDVPPRVEKGATLVPLRFVSEGLGAQVAYDPTDRQAVIELDGKSWRLRVPEPQPESPKPLSASGAARFFLQHAKAYDAVMPVSMSTSKLKSHGDTVTFGYRGYAELSGKRSSVPLNVMLELSRDRRRIAFYEVTIASGPFAGLALVTGAP